MIGFCMCGTHFHMSRIIDAHRMRIRIQLYISPYIPYIFCFKLGYIMSKTGVSIFVEHDSVKGSPAQKTPTTLS